jgi:hypothetical protein
MRRLEATAAAIGCGGLAGCFYLAVATGAPGAMLLVYLTQLPLFVAGLWLGAGAAALAGLTGCVMLLVADDALAAATFAAFNACPVALLVRQALLARRRADGTLSWYPPGQSTAWLTAIALVGIASAIVLLGGTAELRAAISGVIAEVIARISTVPQGDRTDIADTLAMIVPGVVAVSWMIAAIGNAVLAQGLLARFGANWRPSPDLARLSLPLWIPIALGVAAAATMLGGSLRFIGVNAMIALIVPFGLAGLAVLHVAARRLAQPTIALVFFYTVAALFGWPFLGVAVLGLLESWLGLRRRLAPQGVSLDG